MGQNLQRREVDSVRLDSWKEIAAFFNRDTRTVRRWESDRNLPVHRVPGGERSGVFAYVSELEDWLRTPRSYSARGVSGPAARRISAATKSSPLEILAVSPASETSEVLDDPAVVVPDSGGMEGASGAVQESDAASLQIPEPISALHVLNSYNGTFTAATESDFTPPTFESSPSEGMRRSASQTGLTSLGMISTGISQSLLLVFAALICIALLILHFHQPRANVHVAHKPSPEAQDLYLRGRYVWNLRTEEGLTRAVDLFTQSIVNDPQYAPAYAGLADSYLLLRQYGHMPDAEAYPRALAAARQAIALDDSSPDAHRSLAFILRFWNWDLPESEREYRRAIALNPGNSQSHHWYATALLASGRAKEALAEIDIARSLEPQSVSILADRGLILYSVDAKAGVAALQQLEHSEPAFPSTHRYLADIFLAEGAYDRFLAETRMAADINHDAASLSVLDRAETNRVGKGSGPMLLQLATELSPLADRGTTPAYTVARLFSLAGKDHDALRYLRLSVDRRESYILNIDRDSTFAGLHSLPEFQAIAREIDGPIADEEYAARSIHPQF